MMSYIDTAKDIKNKNDFCYPNNKLLYIYMTIDMFVRRLCCLPISISFFGIQIFPL